MQFNQPLFTIALIVIAYIVVLSVIISWKGRQKLKKRNGFIWKLIAFDGLVFSFGLVAVVAVQPQSLLNNVVFVVYDFIITYALIVELPSYLKIAKYDDKLSDSLTEIRSDLVALRYSSKLELDSLQKKIQENKEKLEDEKIDWILSDFVAVTQRLKNINDSLWSLTLSEISNSISNITTRSKHPFPKLVDILALSGLSVLIAEFLKLLG